MLNGIFPIFTKGRVLKKESIEYLRDFPGDLASLAYGDYSDGIISGFSIGYEEGNVLISKGVLKYQGNIIIVSKNSTAITEYDQLLYIKLIIGEVRENEDYKICKIEIVIDKNEPNKADEIELGRFCLNLGAVLRCGYDSFNDLRTPENTLDITHVSYAGIKEATLHPRVLKEFAGAVMAGSSDALDINFALMCLNSLIVHKNSIQWYIAKKHNTGYKDYTLTELYIKLSELLPQDERKEKPAKPRGRGPSIS